MSFVYSGDIPLLATRGETYTSYELSCSFFSSPVFVCEVLLSVYVYYRLGQVK